MPVKHAIIGILARRMCHGYEIKGEFDRLTGGLWELNVGQIYSTLERLLKDGLVALEEAADEGEDRKIYRTTPAGIQALHQWLGRAPLKPKPVRDELFVRLALLMEHDPGAAVALLESHRRICHIQMAELTRQKLALGRGPARERRWQGLLLDAALLHLEADMKWLEVCDDKLTEGGAWS